MVRPARTRAAEKKRDSKTRNPRPYRGGGSAKKKKNNDADAIVRKHTLKGGDWLSRGKFRDQVRNVYWRRGEVDSEGGLMGDVR